MPPWVAAGFREYAKRMPAQCRLQLREVPAGRRTKGVDIKRLLREEGKRLLAAVPPMCRIIALERNGRKFTTEELAEHLHAWMLKGIEPALLIGGPEGLERSCIERADAVWSLSALTLAHPLVRVVLAEQLYRAWSITQNLPYHR